MSTNLIWIDENLDIEENQDYAKELNSFLSLHAKFFKNLEEAFEHLKNIKFQETKVILSGKLYTKFIQKFKENIKDICVAPKLIIFTRDKKNLVIIIRIIKMINFIILVELLLLLKKLKNF